MTKCLSEARIRAAADDEANELERQHLEACADCRARVDAARRASDEFAARAAGLAVPASLRDGVALALMKGGKRGGATTLRDLPSRGWSSRVWLSAGAVAVVVLLVVFLLPPLDAPRALSAAEILDRSLRTLSPATGTELREFDLRLQLPRIASLQNGTYRIEQLVDHDTSGRYRVVRYAPDGTLLDAVIEDPAAGRRTAVVRLDGQPFVFSFTIDPAHTLPLRDLERHHVEAMIRLLQAAAGQTVHEVDNEHGKRYVVELPQVGDANESGLWELRRARVVVDAADFHIVELTAEGSYMGEGVFVSFHLRRRHVRPSTEVPSEAFDVPVDPNAIAVEAPGTDDLAHDLLVSALRELAKSRR
jgi:hypothetical protein